MNKVIFQIIGPQDQTLIELIASWYHQEWKIEPGSTCENIRQISAEQSQFQILMLLDGEPIATGGIYNHVGLLDKMPRLKRHKKWLALVYVIPEFRGKGYGGQLCDFIQQHAQNIGLNNIYLFTHTAERLYVRMGWKVMERLNVNDREIAVMGKKLGDLER